MLSKRKGKTKMKNIIKTAQCPRKCYLSQQKLLSKTNKAYDSATALRHLMGDEEFKNWKDLETINKYYKNLPYYLQNEKAREVTIVQTFMQRFVDYFYENGFVLIDKMKKVTMPSYGREIKGCFDLVYKDMNDVVHCAFIVKKTTVGKGSSCKNYIGNNLKYQIAYRLAKKEYQQNFVVEEIALMYLNENGASEPKTMKKEYKAERMIKTFNAADADLKQLRIDAATTLPEDENCEDALFRLSDLGADRNAPKNLKHCPDCQFSSLCGFTQQKQSDPELVEEQYKDRSNVHYSESQIKVIEFEKGTCRVLAGPGSGKTTTLVSRVINLLQKGYCEPKDFLLITFTEKGCNELKEKLNSFMKTNLMDMDVNEFNIHTFNSFGAKVISENYEALGFSKEPQLIDQCAVYDTILELLDRLPVIQGYNYQNPLLNFFKAKGVVVKTAEIFKDLKAHGVLTLEEMKKEIPEKQHGICISPAKGKLGSEYYEPPEYYFDYDTFFKLYKGYLDLCKENCYIDYDDQIYLALSCLNDPTILNKYNYKHIMIDEYQDTSESQFEIVRLLAKQYRTESLLVCGDDAQGIFGFRGVSIDNILNFPSQYPNAALFSLDDNFRSTKQIVSFSQKLLRYSSRNLKKKAIAHKEGNPVIYINDLKEKNTNSIETCANLIKTEIKKGTPEEDIAILSRTHKNLALVANELRKNNVSYVFAVTEPLIENQTFLAIKGLTNFMVDPTLYGELVTYLMTVKYKEFQNAEYMDDFVKIEAKLLADELSVKDEQQKFDFLLETIREIKVDQRAMKVLLDEFKTHAITTVTEANEYLQKIVDYNADIEIPKDDNRYQAVTLSTVHAAKGREFKKVYVLLNGFKLPPLFNNLQYSGDEEEELRLLYVAVTRAEELCVLLEDGQDYKFCEKCI